MKFKLWILVSFLFAYASPGLSAGYTDWAIPANVELVSGGVLIAGEYGDPSNCGQANYIFVKQSDSRYKDALSFALAALMSKREMRFYVSSCTQVGAHWTGNVINESRGGQPLYIR